MATATLKEKAKKAFNAIAGTQEDPEPVLYHIDTYSLKEWDARINPVLEAGNIAIMAMNKFYPVDSIDEFFNGLLKNPEELYRAKIRTKYHEKYAEFEKIGAALTIPIPEEFASVVQAARKAKPLFDKQRREYFALEDGEIVLTEAYYNKRNSRCYLHATGAEEIERLRFCLEVIASIEKLEPILQRDKKFREAIKHKRYALPLPYFLKIVTTPEGKKLIPNPAFILDGFAETSHLGLHFPSKLRQKLAEKQTTPELGPKLRKIRVIDHNGIPTGDIHLVDEKDVNKHMMGPFRLNKNELCDGYYNKDGQPWGTPLTFNHIAITGFTERLLNHVNI